MMSHIVTFCVLLCFEVSVGSISVFLPQGDRFGGALDGAAKQFTEAYDAGMIPMEFVNTMRKKGELIMGIGHRVKSINNPDMRVEILKRYVKDNFTACPLLDYALEVEKITTSKVRYTHQVYTWNHAVKLTYIQYTQCNHAVSFMYISLLV